MICWLLSHFWDVFGYMAHSWFWFDKPTCYCISTHMAHHSDVTQVRFYNSDLDISPPQLGLLGLLPHSQSSPSQAWFFKVVFSTINSRSLNPKQGHLIASKGSLWRSWRLFGMKLNCLELKLMKREVRGVSPQGMSPSDKNLVEIRLPIGNSSGMWCTIACTISMPIVIIICAFYINEN